MLLHALASFCFLEERARVIDARMSWSEEAVGRHIAAIKSRAKSKEEVMGYYNF